MNAVLRVAVRKFGPFETALEKQFADFVRVSGAEARLELVAADLNPLHQALFDERRLAIGDFDLALLSTDWIAAAQAAGLVEDLAPHLGRAPIVDFPEAWSPSLTQVQAFDGGIWGMPYHDGPQCLIYRKDLLAAAGVDVPQTWEEFHLAARRLHAPEHGRYGTVLALYPGGHNSFYDFCIHIWTRGGEPFDASGQPHFVSAEAVAALDFIRMLAADAQAVPPNLDELDSVKSGLTFCAGKVALMTNWFGFAALGESLLDSQVAGKVDIAPLPAGIGGRSVSLNVYWLLAMAVGSHQKRLAWAFMRHCASPAMDRLTTTEGAIGVRRSTWVDPEVNRKIPYYHKLEALHAQARQMPRHPRLAEISHVVDAMLVAARRSNRESADLLAEAQAAIEHIVG